MKIINCGEGTMFEPVATGVYLEGLCADVDSVWVADPIKGGTRRFRRDGTVTSWLPDRTMVGGLLRGPDDIVLISGDGGVIWLDDRTGATGTWVDSCNGIALPGVNEMVATPSGAVYFGGNDIASINVGRTTEPVSIYRRDPDGRVVELVSELRFTNGMGISPDGKRLYCNETFVGTIGFDILADGSLGPLQRLLDKPDCDGMAIDAEGTIWITGFETSAIVRMRPDGTLVDPLPLPGGGATNVRFGGDDLREMYITHVPEGAAMKLKAGIWPETEDSVLLHARSDIAGLRGYRAAVDTVSV